MKTIEEVYNTEIDCSTCGNTRRIRYVDPILGNREQSCKCVGYKKNIEKLKRSRIPKRYLGYDFSDYIHEVGDKNAWAANKKAHTAIVDVVSQHSVVVENAIDNLIYGGKSCGKTMMGCIMLKQLILEHGYSGVFITSDELITLAMDHARYERASTLDEILDVDFLLIDNFHKLAVLDTLKINDNARLVLDDFFSKRKNNGKCFILTSIMSVEALLKKKRFIIEMAYTIIRHTLHGCYGMEARRNNISKLKLGD